MTNVQWADTAKGADFLTALKADDTIGSSFTDCETAAAVAAVLGKETADSTLLQNFATFAASQKSNLKVVNAEAAERISVTADGYYLFEDVSTLTSTTGAKTRYLIAQVDAEKGLDIAVKSSLPSVEKKIKENTKNVAYGSETNETEAYVGTGYNDVADYNIGDAVPFKLIGTLPSTLDDYKTYKYTFHDTLGKEFTAPAKEKIKVSCKTGDTVTDITNKATITVTAASETEGAKINVEFADIKAAGATKDSIITVEYNAVLSSGAVIGLNGQTNEVYLEYSNNPNAGGEGETGNTPVDKVIAFTYELDVNKIDANTQVALKGAKFKLQAADGDHVDKWAKLTKNSEGNYTISEWVADEADATEFENANGNTFAVIGLDSGTYNLKETVAPSGYKTPDKAFKVELTATTANNQDWDTFTASDALTALTVKLDNVAGTVDENKGIGTVTVGNSSGSTLPSTGGIGTTIFYVAGGVLVVGAGVLLITKKRAKDAQ
ncbi:isopeptide-forming domain-containing fimbrial protein [Ruminococcus sp.]